MYSFLILSLSRYERGFAPNVSLAPASHQKEQLEDVSEDEDTPVPDKRPTPEKTASSAAVPNAEKSASSEYREWDVPSESEDSSQPSDGKNHNTSTSASKTDFDWLIVKQILIG